MVAVPRRIRLRCAATSVSAHRVRIDTSILHARTSTCMWDCIRLSIQFETIQKSDEVFIMLVLPLGIDIDIDFWRCSIELAI
jgi:hypothetical protein